ncbi:RxLR effector candidate protein-like protein, partial [Dinothrombium tinctorium]
MYAVVSTRPDITQAVGVLSRFVNDPKMKHWRSAKRVLRYLKGTINTKLRLGGKQSKINLYGYVDADWAGDQSDRRSTSGFVYTICGSVISWISRKQQTVALSTTESEYIAAAAAVQESIWLRALLKELGYDQTAPTVLYEDNQSCIAITKNPKLHSRTKHIDIKYHFVREKVESGEVRFEYCESKCMLADIMTKAIPGPQFEVLRDKLGLVAVDKHQVGVMECDICQRTEDGTLVNKLFLRKKLVSTRLGPGGDMESHIATISEITDQLRAAGDQVEESEVVAIILSSLPETYDSLVTALESRKLEDLTLSFVKSRLIHEFVKLKEKEKNNDSAFLGKHKGQKHVNSNNKEKRKCFHCGKIGHLKANCWKRKNQKASFTQKENQKTNSSDGDFCFNTESENYRFTWCVDSGASRHMSCIKDWFEDYKDITPMTITLADDNTVSAVGVGNIKLLFETPNGYKRGTLKDVLFVPELGSNLLSVGRITSQGYK